MSYTNVTDVGLQGVETIKLSAAAARSKGDLVRISTGNTDGAYVDVALADDTNVYPVAVAAQDIASGDIGDYIVRGTTKVTVPSGNYTAGNGLHIFDGALADSGGAAEAPTGVSTNNDVGVIQTGGTSVTEITVTLHGFAITGQT